ncbi:NAD(P)-dependent alcohol dehydrogenase [Candidatus Thorarchaeota archaeon]|nr:MAG: NAD(P)-dependent alcohol dehydrogenase [Candidatus Thorarchaeota archaeon]
MKAIVGKRYGAPESLQLKEVKKPTPKENEVLIEVRASSLNAADFERLRGSLVTRLTGPLRPKDKIPGTDVSGTVEAVGSSVTQFKPGDEIVGDLFYHGSGAFAEYVCAPEKVLTIKSSSMTFEEAATYPQAAIIALQSLRGEREIQPGQKVLINGAGGGMGTFAVQIAKSYGAEVTGVDSEKKLDMLHSIGADHTIDYTQTDYTNTSQCYDIIIDTVANRSLSDYKRALTHDGLFVMVGGTRSAIFQAAIIAPIKTRNDSQKIGLNWWSKPYNKEDMDFLAMLYDEGKVKPVIDKLYPLSKVPEALKYLEDGHVIGKAVITMDGEFS